MDILRKIKVYADGAVLKDIPVLIERYDLRGFTTNPSLMAQEGVQDYESFAKRLLAAVGGRPVSFEVVADDLDAMRRQALTLASWGENIFVKIPITNTLGEPTNELVRSLSKCGVKLNVTAMFTPRQIDEIVPCFAEGVPSIVSIFAGRIADAGVDPVPIVCHALDRCRSCPNIEVLWASCREVFNVVTAAEIGCHIITVPIAMLGKLSSLGKDLTQFSLETVQMFRSDAVKSGLHV